MSRSRENDVSPGSLIQTRPGRSHTNIRPALSKVSPTASFQAPAFGPRTTVSAKPGGTVAAVSPEMVAETNRKTARTGHFRPVTRRRQEKKPPYSRLEREDLPVHGYLMYTILRASRH